MSEEVTLDDFSDAEAKNSQQDNEIVDTLEQEQFGPFRLSTPGEWTAKRLGDVKRLITRGKQPTYADEGVPVINQECIYWNGWHFENVRYLDEDIAEEWGEKYFPQQGDVILNSTGKGTLGRAQVYPDSTRRAIDSHVTLLRTDEELSPYFHRYFLESHLGQALLYSMCVNGSTGQIELSKTRLDLLPIPLPPLKEQHRVASVLYTVDQAVQKKEEIIEQTERVKQGVVQEIFTYGFGDVETQDIHIGEFPESWEFVKLSEVTNIERGDTPDTSNRDFYSGRIAWVTPDDLSTLYEDGDGKYISDTRRKLTEEGVGSSSLRLVEPNSVMFTSRSYGIGKTAICTVPAATNQGITAFECDDRLNEEFLYYYLNYIMDYIISISGVSTFPEISKSDTGNIDVPVPNIEEQEEIATVLGVIDDKVANDKRTKGRLQRLKRGLMQDLLTGEVRTTHAEIDIPEEVTAYG